MTFPVAGRYHNRESHISEAIKFDLMTVEKHFLYKPYGFSRYYTVTLTCGFELQLYPFDHQKCPIELEVPFEHATHMKLSMANSPTVDDSIKFLQYNLNEVNTKENNSTTLTTYLELNRFKELHYF